MNVELHRMHSCASDARDSTPSGFGNATVVLELSSGRHRHCADAMLCKVGCDRVLNFLDLNRTRSVDRQSGDTSALVFQRHDGIADPDAFSDAQFQLQQINHQPVRTPGTCYALTPTSSTELPRSQSDLCLPCGPARRTGFHWCPQHRLRAPLQGSAAIREPAAWMLL